MAFKAANEKGGVGSIWLTSPQYEVQKSLNIYGFLFSRLGVC
jgi:hypothetical protein